MMDSQVFKLLNDKFDEIREDLHEISSSIKTHVEKDELYWKKIDTQETQVALLKRLILGGSAVVSGIWTVLWAWFSK